VSGDSRTALDHAVNIIRRVCELAGPASCIVDLRTELRASGVAQAVERHDMPALFDWLMSILSYQGIADRVAEGFILEHGNVTWGELNHGYEAIVDDQTADMLTLRWRDYPRERRVMRHHNSVGLLYRPAENVEPKAAAKTQPKPAAPGAETAIPAPALNTGRIQRPGMTLPSISWCLPSKMVHRGRGGKPLSCNVTTTC
jgi:hypothetical protein